MSQKGNRAVVFITAPAVQIALTGCLVTSLCLSRAILDASDQSLSQNTFARRKWENIIY